ncbi:TetR/AcrR family transcriptional regulator [Streptomyces litchfieldiae]|uniref:TetR/AcrR family transcriptional regulator n=1 Tax=Streptomyces litchfieldiae TaxID=3075543 RepID=A0ABU2MIQ9_9ACTN|nr:TetR/AcrR family transcriptional regulator [Streptomyces sp. DSM 44938]MDT0341482.1 TetR/AcrR family transcriptional regulator [Streptomyces sp. DSM 44938]
MSAPHPAAGRPEKRRAITGAARRVFGNEGYVRAGVDAIAAEAGVSKRTIYNHFRDKEDLFLSVALEGAHEVTETIARLLDRHLRKIVDVADDLTAFALERVAAVAEFPEHFALVRTIEAEAARIPPAVLEEWIKAGPQTAHLRLAPYLARMADDGLLTPEDPERAADHFNLLTVVNVNQRTFYGAIPLPPEQVTELVTDGVRTFLRLYGR